MNFKRDDPDYNKRCWPSTRPFEGYFGKCRACEKEFIGPKRAPRCWVCWEEQRIAHETKKAESDASWAAAKDLFEDQPE